MLIIKHPQDLSTCEYLTDLFRSKLYDSELSPSLLNLASCLRTVIHRNLNLFSTSCTLSTSIRASMLQLVQQIDLQIAKLLIQHLKFDDHQLHPE